MSESKFSWSLKVTAPDVLTVVRADGSNYSIHPLWLRERCRDAATLDPQTQQRLCNPSDFASDLKLTSVSQTSPGTYQVSFSDGHEASFSDVDILTEAMLAPNSHDCPAPRLWDAKLSELPRARWTSDLGDAEMLAGLESFLTTGFVIFENVPVEHGAVIKVAEKFGFLRALGSVVLWDVRSDPSSYDLSMTSLALEAHTDNPYRAEPPEVQMLHCLTNETSGGLSTLVDGFAVAQTMRERHPEAFDVLAHTPVRFKFIRVDRIQLTASASHIELDVTGALKGVRYSPRVDYVPLLEPEKLESYFRARRLLANYLRSPDFEIRFLLKPGELLIMDNRRLLHGRTGFNPTEGLRHLEGCYLDFEGMRSLYRVLRERLSSNPS
jgi:gamma-butyrobetaine dioxygenase